MKPKLILFILLLSVVKAYPQLKNTVSFVYGITSNSVNIYGAIGDFGFNGKGGAQFGVNYTRDFTPHFSLQSGLMLSSDNIQLTTVGPNSTGPKDGNIKLLTIPVIAKISFLKYAFVDGGLLADFQTNFSGSDAVQNQARKQNGVGFELGLGGQYNAGRFNVFVNPFLQDHSLRKFYSNNAEFTLLDAGFKFGAGYRF